MKSPLLPQVVIVGTAAALFLACSGAADSDLLATNAPPPTDTTGGDAASGSSSTGGSSTSGSSTSSSSTSSSSTSSSSTSGSSGASKDAGAGAPCDASKAEVCPANQYCRRDTCDTLKGTCQLRPIQNSVAAPVCGCDGVSYWNETVAGAAGISVRAQGACPANLAVKCNATVAGRCQNERFCDLPSASLQACGVQVTGTCWGLPIVCPTEGADRRACIGSNKCKGACQAIRDQRPYYPDANCN